MALSGQYTHTTHYCSSITYQYCRGQTRPLISYFVAADRFLSALREVSAAYKIVSFLCLNKCNFTSKRWSLECTEQNIHSFLLTLFCQEQINTLDYFGDVFCSQPLCVEFRILTVYIRVNISLWTSLDFCLQFPCCPCFSYGQSSVNIKLYGLSTIYITVYKLFWQHLDQGCPLISYPFFYFVRFCHVSFSTFFSV